MSKLLSTSATTLAFAICLFSPAARADFVTNGSFEADSCTGSGTGYRLGLVGTAMAGWFIPATDGTYPWCLQNANAFAAGPAADGNQWLVLGETGASGGTPHDYTIQQTMTGLTPGNTYQLMFDISSEGKAGSAVAEVSFLSGSSTAAQDFFAPPAVSTFWNPWGAESMNFVATASTVTMQFKDLAIEFPSGEDLGLDKVSVNAAGAVPEPKLVLLLACVLAGLALKHGLAKT